MPESPAYIVHHLYGEDQEVHRNYGLRIFKWLRGYVAEWCDSVERQRYFEFYCLSHMYDGGGRLWLPEQGVCRVEAGDCIVIPCGQIHWYGPERRNRYVEDSLCFTGAVADMLFRSGVISSGVVRMGFQRQLLPVIELAENPAPASQLAANIALQKLLFSIFSLRQKAQADDKIDGVMQLMRENYGRWYQVRELAQLCKLSDDQFRRLFVAKTGMSPVDLQKVSELGVALNNAAIDGKPDDLVINTHVCRGNYHSTYAFEGGYDPIAPYLFANEDVDAFYLEFDTPRAGGFEPLRYVAPGKKVVLGLVTTKAAELEDEDTIVERIHEAAKYVPLENLCLSPQCGFASCEIGNKLTEEEQWAKIALVKRIAERVWK